MENALKYEPDGGSVCIAVCRQKKKALLRVENAGSVIEPEDLPHVFERFYRGDKTRNQQKGHGLGLPIIKQMSELQGGEISVISSADQGTVFTVAFPANERQFTEAPLVCGQFPSYRRRRRASVWDPEEEQPDERSPYKLGHPARPTDHAAVRSDSWDQ